MCLIDVRGSLMGAAEWGAGGGGLSSSNLPQGKTKSGNSIPW